MADTTVAAGTVRALLDFAAGRGAKAKALTTFAGLDRQSLDDPDARLPFDCYVRLMRAAKRLTDDPALALHFGETVELADFSVVGVVAAPPGTVADGVTPLNRYARLAVEADPPDGDRFALERSGAAVWLVDRRPNPELFPELTESTFARIVSASRRVGKGDFVQEVHVTHEEPEHSDEYRRIFAVPLVFGAERNALRLDPNILDAAIPTQSGYAHGLIVQHAEKLLAQLASAKSMRGRLERELLLMLPQGRAGVENAAKSLGISRQTLHRRLKAEGASFETVLKDLRRRLALAYLREDRLPVADAALRLGFSDRAAFAKAFKRWTGMTPGEVRERSRGDALDLDRKRCSPPSLKRDP